MHVPFMKEQQNLLLGKIHIYQPHGDAMERKVPSCEPGVFPGIRHENDVSGIEVAPGSIALTLWRWRRFSWISAQPFLNIVHVELFAPQQTGKCLSLYCLRIITLVIAQTSVKGICFFYPYIEELLHRSKRSLLRIWR